MRIGLNRERCESNGICVGMAPDVFDFDGEDNLVLVDELHPAERDLELRQVAAACPTSALSVHDR